MPRTVPKDSAAPSLAEVQDWLEWAGAKLLAMRIKSPAPAGYRSYWPDFAEDITAAYGYTKETMRAPAVAPHEITQMDAILSLPALIVDVRTRRIVHRRALVAPVSGRHVYSFTKIGRDFHVSRQRVAQLHTAGLLEIADWMKVKQVYALRRFFAPASLSS